jgi:hypothetical protein
LCSQQIPHWHSFQMLCHWRRCKKQLLHMSLSKWWNWIQIFGAVIPVSYIFA